MKTKEYEQMRKIGERILADPENVSVEDAIEYVLLMEKSKADEVLKACNNVLRANAAEKKKEYVNSLGTITVSEPYIQAVNEEEFITKEPEKYREIWNKKAAKIKLAVADLDKDDRDKYVHFVKGTAKVTVRLA